MFLGLDVSTATIGVTIFDNEKKLYRMTHLGLNIKKDKLENPNESIYLKKKMFEKFLIDDVTDLGITKCFIEEPLSNTGMLRSRHTGNLLIQFNGMISDSVYNILNLVPYHISVYDCRKIFFPEFVKISTVKGEEKQTLSFPKDVDKKEEVWKKVASLEPQVKWAYTGKGKLIKENYDMADSYVVTVAGIKLYS